MSKLIEDSKKIRQKAEAILKKDTFNDKPTIVVFGLMNAGKSYLLNMLTEHIDSEYFKTNDRRETAVNKAFESDNCIFLDTPGLDANDDDDQNALNGIKQADIVLFVHQLQGELEKVEIDFLKQVVQSFGDYASDNIIMVLSKIDKESPEKVNEIESKVLYQCKNQLGFSPKCFQISNTRYQKGVIEHKDGLIRHSHILELNDRIKSVLKNGNNVRQIRAKHDKAEIIKELQHHWNTLWQERKKLGTEMLEPLNTTNFILSQVSDYLKEKQQVFVEYFKETKEINDRIDNLKKLT